MGCHTWCYNLVKISKVPDKHKYKGHYPTTMDELLLYEQTQCEKYAVRPYIGSYTIEEMYSDKTFEYYFNKLFKYKPFDPNWTFEQRRIELLGLYQQYVAEADYTINDVDDLDDQFRECPRLREHLGTEIILGDGRKVLGVMFVETEFHDLFRIGGYPETQLFSLDETIDFIGQNQLKKVDYLSIFKFWQKYPDGLIEFG